MGAINARGVYVYDETDTAAKASNMLNKQSDALTAREAVAAGRATLSSLPASSATDLVVSLPAGRFPSAPRVVASLNVPVAWAPQPIVRVLGVSATSFTLQLYSTAARTGVSVDWVAVG